MADTLVVSFIDGLISINGEAYTCPMGVGPSHANYGPAYVMKWFGEHGFIKYEQGPPVSITDPEQFGDFVDLWMATRSDQLDAEAAEYDRQLASIKAYRETNETNLASLQATESSQVIDRLIEYVAKTVNKSLDMEAELDTKSKDTKDKSKKAKEDHAQHKEDKKLKPKPPKPLHGGGDHG